VTAAGRNNAETFRYIRAAFDVAGERQAREDAGVGEQIDEAVAPSRLFLLAPSALRGSPQHHPRKLPPNWLVKAL